jgi:hypothetical protein
METLIKRIMHIKLKCQGINCLEFSGRNAEFTPKFSDKGRVDATSGDKDLRPRSLLFPDLCINTPQGTAPRGYSAQTEWVVVSSDRNLQCGSISCGGGCGHPFHHSVPNKNFKTFLL